MSHSQGKSSRQKAAVSVKEMKPQDLSNLRYMQGFANQFVSEAEPGALPAGQNSPQKAPYGLYPEQLSGSSFTALRHENLRSWLYRIRPSVLHAKFVKMDNGYLRSRPFPTTWASPNQMRWNPLPYPKKEADFIDSLITVCGNGDLNSWRGLAVHIYAANKSMHDRFFYDADGELLLVAEEGSVLLRTEFGDIAITPGEIAVIPRGIKFQLLLPEGKARGYVLENYGLALRLPSLGPIGSNGLANPRDFQTPCARYEEIEKSFQLVAKFNGQLWRTELNHSPLDVVAWHGNYAPYKYDLKLFNVINTVSFDHPDPSIFTVLTSPSEIPGFANCDFVIFPPRWMVAEHTFRPPYYHRNMMSEYMGLIFGRYDAKEEGFVPGGGSLHNAMSAHGPDSQTFQKASQQELSPQFIGNTLAFMFESSLIYQPTEHAVSQPFLQDDYLDCWQDLPANFHRPD